MAESTTVSIDNIELFQQKALCWASQFKVVCLLDSNSYPQKHSSKEWVLAVDAVDEIRVEQSLPHCTSLNLLKQFHYGQQVDIFGFLSYDLKNEIEELQSNHVDYIQFPLLYFFKPRYKLELTGNKFTVNRNYPETFELIERINAFEIFDKTLANRNNTQLQSRTSKQDYLKNVEAIRQQIINGDFYELNYCNEFYKEGEELNAVDTFLKLNDTGKAPFSTFFKLNGCYLLCASPERFLRKQGTQLLSQPVKGTIKKGKTEEENICLRSQLQSDEKERAENVMIVDLTRNDLSHSSKPGSVKVDELFGVYEFNTVHQLVSTVISEIEEGVHFTDVIKHAFPMGSMTGAPKVEVMKNIEIYENFKRSLYSGSVGYITPESDFDFNVVIRSIFYNEARKYISVRAGGAITFDSDAEKEWSEIQLKAESMFSVL